SSLARSAPGVHASAATPRPATGPTRMRRPSPWARSGPHTKHVGNGWSSGCSCSGERIAARPASPMPTGSGTSTPRSPAAAAPSATSASPPKTCTAAPACSPPHGGWEGGGGGGGGGGRAGGRGRAGGGGAGVAPRRCRCRAARRTGGRCASRRSGAGEQFLDRGRTRQRRVPVVGLRDQVEPPAAGLDVGREELGDVLGSAVGRVLLEALEGDLVEGLHRGPGTGA